MLDHRMSVTLCTDNRLVSHTDISKEIRLAIEHLGVDHRELRNILIHGFKRSFFHGSYSEKRAWVRQVIDYYDGIILKASEEKR
jgi:adenosine deaminase